MKLAILTPFDAEKAETFIKNHIKELPFEKIIIYGGSLPYKCATRKIPLFIRWLFKIQCIFNKKGKSLREKSLTYILEREKVTAVFAEYIHVGANVVPVCKSLKLPLYGIGLGYEISKYEMIDKNKDSYKAFMQYASKIFVVSKHMRVNLEKLGCDPAKIIYSPAGPTNSFFEIIPNFDNQQLLAVGRFVDKKAPYLTLFAFQKVLIKVPTATLVFAGDGMLLNACIDIVRVLGIESSVEFIGRIDTQRHKKLLKESFVFVQHSKTALDGDSEGTPVAILEASAAGLPIVSTYHAGIPDTVLDNETGFLVAEGDVDQMATKIIALLLDKNKAMEFGNYGKKYIRENFSEEQHIRILADEISSKKVM